MSLLTNQSQLNNSSAFWAPASGGGGGGGGPNLVVSTLTVADGSSGDNGLIFAIPNTSTLTLASDSGGDFPALGATLEFVQVDGNSVIGVGANLIAGSIGLVGQGGNYATQTPAILAGLGNGTVSVSSMTISSINGAAPGGGGGGNPANLTTSSITVAGAAAALGADFQIYASDTNLYTLTTASTGTQLVSVDVGLSGGRNQVRVNGPLDAQLIYGSTIIGTTGVISLNPDGTDSIVLGGLGAPGDIKFAPTGGGVINCLATTNIPGSANISSLTVSSINGTAPGGSVVSTFPGLTVSSPTAALLTLNGGTNQLVAGSLNTAQAIIYGTGTGLTLSTVTQLNGQVPLTMGVQPFNTPTNFQCGYAQDVPYTSTILFTSAFSNDKVCVMLTPTSRNVSSGANPNMSLVASFGNNGVSSIGFQVDSRDGGVGYAGSFYYIATSL